MKRMVFSLLLAGAALLHGSALAMPDGAVLEAYLGDGPAGQGGITLGTLRFVLDSQVPHACRYAVEWTSGGTASASTICYFEEARWWGHQSCEENASSPLQSILMLSS